MPLIQWIMQNLVRAKRACVHIAEREETAIAVELEETISVSWRTALETSIATEIGLVTSIAVSQRLGTTIEISAENC